MQIGIDIISKTIDPYKTYDYIKKDGIDKIFILYDVYSEEQANKIKELVINKISDGDVK